MLPFSAIRRVPAMLAVSVFWISATRVRMEGLSCCLNRTLCEVWFQCILMMEHHYHINSGRNCARPQGFLMSLMPLVRADWGELCPLEGRKKCCPLCLEGWVAYFLFLQLNSACHAVLLSVMSCEGKLWTDRGKEEQLLVQGDQLIAS